MKEIAKALATAQTNMTKALKQSNNPHFRSRYADLGNVMDACLPALNGAGIALIQPTGEDDSGRFVETIFVHGESGEQLSCRVPLIVAKHDMQGFGSAVTYARRYGLMTMAGIAPEDDDGNAASKAPPQEQRKPEPPSQEAISRAADYLAEADTIDDLKERWAKLPKNVQGADAVIAAKDATKNALNPPITDDDIPY